jgi:type I restriction enzyme S subunit
MTKTGTKVVLNLSAPDNMKRVQPGDLIAHLRSFQGGLEKSDLAGKVSTAYTVIEPLATADPNFFRWVLKSPPYIQTLSSSLEQLRDGQSVKFGDFAAIPLPLPPIDEQRRIADFLDDRVARIDQIIAARRTQMDHVDDALDAEWNSLGARLVEHGPVIPLRRVLASIVDGPFGSSLTSSHYTDEGTRVIRLGNIGKAAFRDGDAAFISDQYAAELRSHSVSPGDLLMAGLGDERWPLGRCAVAPEDLGPAIVKADCYRIRLGRVS